ncbi:hypothetical protein [Serinibacter salmoneus]|uniref:Secreted protein n=1 Tax=Serinibacter salmoneus TaxID=556530 RepID=A0A2A9CZU2_9MICO|nr:hypothetical protein [Serinibacter salmoneus]PFG19120.1 hypothetical protein ATL40_0676 [Serinibacter salmoneus]
MTRTISRRSVLSAAAWSAPVVAVVAAAPAYAVDSTTAKNYGEAIVVTHDPNVGTNGQRAIFLYGAQVDYQPEAIEAAWAGQNPYPSQVWNAFPAAFMVTWRVAVYDATGAHLGNLYEGTDQVDAHEHQQATNSRGFPVSAAGTYTVTTEVLAITPVEMDVAGVGPTTFLPPLPAPRSATIKVN